MKTQSKLGAAIIIALLIMLTMCLQAFTAEFKTVDSYNRYLIKSLEDENIGIRTSAAVLLGDRKVVDAVKPLVNMLENEKDYSARIVAAISLYKIGDDSIIPILEKQIKKDKNKTVRHVLSGIVQEMKANQLANLSF